MVVAADLPPGQLLIVEDSANAVVSVVQQANRMLAQMRSELANAKVIILLSFCYQTLCAVKLLVMTVASLFINILY